MGALDIADAVTLDQLNALTEDERAKCLLAPDSLLQTLPADYLDEEATLRFSHGNPVSSGTEAVLAPGKCRVYGANRLLGLGVMDDAGKVHPRRLVCA